MELYSAKMNSLFKEELKKGLSRVAAPDAPVITEKQLDAAGEQKTDEGASAEQVSKTEEPQLAGERGSEEKIEKQQQQLPEGQLSDKRKEAQAAAPNADLQGITEKRLDNAKTVAYPHRNEKAWKRTGDKRPINALREEMGEQSDEARVERYDKACKKAQELPERIVDKDIGKQKEVIVENGRVKSAFNRSQRKATTTREVLRGYIEYKAGLRFNAKATKLDGMMEDILVKAQGEKRNLTDDEKAKITALKQEKGVVLGYV